MNWENFEFGDIVEKIKGGGTPSKQNQEYWNGDIYWASVKDMEEGKYKLSSTQDTITQIGLENSASNLIPKDTLIIATRMGLGRAFINEVDLTINQDLKAIFPKKEFIDTKFLLWWYVNNGKYIESLGNGATVKGIRLEHLKAIKISLPPLPTQKRIASILSAYDDSIENNLKRIKLLEETAQNIYKEWFVHFRFPNYEHTAFDEASGVPVGWEMKTINDFGKVITGKTPSTANANFYGGNIPFVKTPDMHDAPYVLETNISLTNEGAETQNNKYLPKNSVMVSCIGTAGVVSLTSESCQTNQQINSVKFDEEYKSFYFYGFARGLKSLLEGLGSNGATMVNVNKSKFENISLLVPNTDILIKYDKCIKSFFEQVLVLQQQNQKLKKARDILLPRLMNRTIEV